MTSCRAAFTIGRESGWNVWTITRPGRIPSAPAGQLGDELEGALFGPEVGHPEACVGVDDGGQCDPGEVVSLRDHLGADEHGSVRLREAPQRRRQLRRAANSVGIEPDPL